MDELCEHYPVNTFLLMLHRYSLFLLFALLALAGPRTALGQAPTITGLSPTRNLRNAPVGSNVAITFSQPLSSGAATLGAVKVFSQQRGGLMQNGARGTTTASGNTLTFAPATSFKPGETIYTAVTTAAQSTGGNNLAAGQIYQFTTAVGGTGRGNFLPPATTPEVSVNSSSAPLKVVLADADGDGDLDLYALYGTGVNIRLNGGDATGSNTGVFSGGSSIRPPSGNSCNGFDLGDLDGDGDLDLFLAGDGTQSTNGIPYYLNNGAGNYSLRATTSGIRADEVALGDVDGDGDLDVVQVRSGGGGTLEVRLNDGTGIFSTGGSIGAPFLHPQLSLADLDNDGDLDLLVANYTVHNVLIYLNNGMGTFAAGQTLATLADSQSAVVGDIDGDGDLDIIFADGDNSFASVRRNAGNGTFATDPNVPTSGTSLTVVLADVDADGDLDLLATCDNNTVNVRLNDGTGTFTTPTTGAEVAVGSSPQGLAVGDIDGDGDVDLVTGNNGANTVSVRLNQPLPTITSLSPTSGAAGTSVTVMGTNLADVTAVLVNGTAGTITGTPTATSLTFLVGAGTTSGIVTATAPSGTSNGGPTFTVVAPNTTIVSGPPALTNSRTVSFVFSSDQSPVDYTTSGAPSFASTGNGASSNFGPVPDGSYTLSVAAHNTDTNLTDATPATYSFTVDATAPTATISSTAGASGSSTGTSPIPFTVTFSEAVTGFSAASLTVTNGTVSNFAASSGTTYTFTVTPTTAGTATTVAVAANVTQDAAGNGNTATAAYSLTYVTPVPGIVSFSPTSGPIGTSVTITGTNFNPVAGQNVVFFGATQATVTAASPTSLTVSVPLGTTYQYPSVTNLASARTAYANQPFVVTLNGGVAFQPKVDFAVNGLAYAVSIGDVDGDGKSDLAVASYNNNTVSVFRNTATAGSLNAATFAAKVDFATGAGPTAVSIGDVDGDGKPDLVVANNANATVSVFRNTATAGSLNASSFAAKVDFATDPTPSSISIEDLDGDGKSDLVTTNNSSNTISVLRNTATLGGLSAGSFAAKVTFATGGGPHVVAISDVDGDGKPDLVTANNSINSVSVFRNTATAGSLGAASFAARVDFSTGANAYSVSIGDVDGDGKPDLAVVNRNSATVSVLRNTATAGSLSASSFAANVDFATGTNPYSVSIGDMDGDGKPDLAVANNGSNSVSVLRNTTTAGSLSAGSFAAKLDFATGAAPFFVSIGDMDGDGKPDLAVANNGSNSVSVLRQAVPAPVVVAPANGSLLNTSKPTYSGTAAGGSTLVTVYVDNVPLATAAVSGNAWTFTPATPLSDGPHTVQALATDARGEASAFSLTNTFTIDTTRPTVAITSTASSPTSTAPIPVTVTFSEPVTGFGAGSVSVTNGSLMAGSFGGSGTTYTFTVTPTAGGLVTVDLAANAAQDAATNGNVAAPQFSITYAVPVTFTTWTGTVSPDWYTAGNWSAGVPTASLDAVIPAGTPRYPLIAANTAAVRSLTLNAGASLTQTGGTLDVRGDLTNSGTFTATSGTVSLGQATPASILGSSSSRFWNLSVGASGAQLGTPAATQVQQVLTLTGNLTTNGNPFTLLSSFGGGQPTDALVVNSSGVVVGTATVQRAIDPRLNAGLGYRHYSAPVSNTTVADLATSGFTPVINPSYNTSATPTAEVPFPTVYGYDESRTLLTNNLSAFDKGYVSPTALSNPLTAGRGYTVNIGAGQLVDFVGTLNNGDLSLNLTNNRTANAAAGWHLVGNPYPAPLDYRLVAPADRPNLEAAAYVFSSTSQYGGQYRAYTNGIGNPLIAMGQGFFVRVQDNGQPGTMTFHNSQRLTAPVATTFQRTTAETRPLVQLTLQGAGSPLIDETYVYFEVGATAAGTDATYDAQKLPNTNGLSLAALAGGQALAIDGLPLLGTATLTVPLALAVPAPGTYSLQAAQLLNLTGQYVYLRDTQLGTLIDLRQQASYPFTLSAATSGARFELVFSPQQPLATVPAALAQQVAVYPNPAHAQVAIELPVALSRQPVTAALVDALGRTVRQQVLPAGLATHSLPLAELAPGVYALRLSTEAGVVVKKLVIE